MSLQETKMNLQQMLDEIVQNSSGTYGVAVKHLNTGEFAGVNQHERFQLASTFKIPILVTLFRDVNSNKLKLEDIVTVQEEDFVTGSGVIQYLHPGVQFTIKDLATLMIIVSDNLATDLILKLVGTENVTSYMKELGLSNTFIHFSCRQLLNLSIGLDLNSFLRAEEARSVKWDFDYKSLIFQSDSHNNVSTPVEMALLVEKIARKEIITEKSCEDMLDILLKQQFNSRLPYLLPSRTKVAHKTGTIGNVINDVGIVYLPEGKGAFSIAVLSKESVSMEEGERTIGRLAKAAYDYFLNK